MRALHARSLNLIQIQHVVLVGRLGFADEPHDTRLLRGVPDELGPLETAPYVLHGAALPARPLGVRPSRPPVLSRPTLVAVSPLADKLERVAFVLGRAMRCPKTLRCESWVKSEPRLDVVNTLQGGSITIRKIYFSRGPNAAMRLAIDFPRHVAVQVSKTSSMAASATGLPWGITPRHWGCRCRMRALCISSFQSLGSIGQWKDARHLEWPSQATIGALGNR